MEGGREEGRRGRGRCREGEGEGRVVEVEFEWGFCALSASKGHIQGENIQMYNLFSPVMMERKGRGREGGEGERKGSRGGR